MNATARALLALTITAGAGLAFAVRTGPPEPARLPDRDCSPSLRGEWWPHRADPRRVHDRPEALVRYGPGAIRPGSCRTVRTEPAERQLPALDRHHALTEAARRRSARG